MNNFYYYKEFDGECNALFLAAAYYVLKTAIYYKTEMIIAENIRSNG